MSYLVESLSQDTCRSLALFGPELSLCAAILVLLLARVFRISAWIDSFYLALAGAGVGLWYALPAGGFAALRGGAPQEIFTGLLVYDSMSVYVRTLLLGFAVLFVLFTKMTGLGTKEDGADFYTLVLGATLGFCIMASANHLLTIFLGVEMASVPSYVLAGVLKGRARSSEAALKYAVYGAGAAGVMLYGISLLAGLLGSAHLPTMAQQLVAMDLPTLLAEGGDGRILVLALAGLMVMVGLAFKLSAVPFHFWCPDVFEGAPAEVGAFLSVASKAAALTLLVRVAIGLGVAPSAHETPTAVAAYGGIVTVSASDTTAGEKTTGGTNAGEKTAGEELVVQTVLAAESNSTPTIQPVKAETETGDAGAADVAGAEDAETGPSAALQPVRQYMMMLVALLAAVSCTFGNLAAYGQTNIKRMLAYSTIAHAGYMIMPVAAALAVAGTDTVKAQDAIAALAFYMAVYLFMNTGAFAVVALFRRVLGSEEIRDYAGLVRSCPLTVLCFSALLVSLIGLPPLAGFIGKLYIFKVLVFSSHPVTITLLVVAGVNTAISLVYYLRVVKVMTIDAPVEGRSAVSVPFIPATFITAMTVPVLVLGVWFQDLLKLAEDAAAQLFL